MILSTSDSNSFFLLKFLRGNLLQWRIQWDLLPSIKFQSSWVLTWVVPSRKAMALSSFWNCRIAIAHYQVKYVCYRCQFYGASLCLAFLSSVCELVDLFCAALVKQTAGKSKIPIIGFDAKWPWQHVLNRWIVVLAIKNRLKLCPFPKEQNLAWSN